MRNLIKEYWKPEYSNDSFLIGLRGQLSGVLSTYEAHLERYRTAEDDSAVEKEESAWLEDHGMDYNEKVVSLESRFRHYVRIHYGHAVP